MIRTESIESKPLLRGWFHAVAAALALAFTIAGLWRTWGDGTRLLALTIFGASMVEMYAVSAVYHIGRWTGTVRRVLNTIDHADIFILIAATYTPVCVIVLTGWMRIAILVTVWVLALTGVRLSVFTRDAPIWVVPVLSIGMGWISVLMLPSLFSALPLWSMILLIVGGALYTLGGLIFTVRWPNPAPRVFGFHEIFHLFVIAAGACFAIVVWFSVLPFTHA